MIVRTVQDGDIDAVAALYRACGVRPRAGTIEWEIAAKRSRDPELYLLADDGRVVGSVMGGYDGHRGYIHRLVVDPACRQRGIGRGLVDELENRLRVLGVPKVNLSVFRGNDPAHDFWVALGYPVDTAIVPHTKLLG